MDDTHIYPSKLRRAIMIVVFLIALFVFYVFALYFLLSGRCFLYNECGSLDEVIRIAVIAICVAGFVSTLYFGAKGHLWGARKKPRME